MLGVSDEDICVEWACGHAMVRFGIVVPQEGVGYRPLLRIARECEGLGFESIWLYDHLSWSTASFLECWTTLTALAWDTERIRLGSLVLNNSLRLPQVLAKMASTIDVVSGGRLELGIGPGTSNPIEYQMYGMTLEKPAVRVQRLKEAVQIIRKLWTEDRVTFKGKHYTVTEAFCNPKPVQKPLPPIWLSARGGYMLKVVAQLADGWNYCNSIDGFEDRMKILDGFCHSIGRLPGSIQRSWHGGFLMGDDRRRITKALQEKQPNFLEPEQYLRRTHLIPVENVDECLSILGRLIRGGASYLMLTLPFAWNPDEALRSLALYSKEILPSLR